ncbi:hypothetical protein [Mucilaginibacter sp. 44-25]|uniref:hypothetical protein n=1 Tax=Mucilaginibacter sp. 44-25 TaxID=1895794 RepID=UPI000967D122|nr:hypothetical protein [Mucilaginibacter sp. 44-25]OJW12551.1 MAG: hypothetical protein BGO48_05515 [Mucilaginibacter sp. 44-25]
MNLSLQRDGYDDITANSLPSALANGTHAQNPSLEGDGNDDTTANSLPSALANGNIQYPAKMINTLFMAVGFSQRNTIEKLRL